MQVTQSKYTNKTETKQKQRPTTRGMDTFLWPFKKRNGLLYTPFVSRWLTDRCRGVIREFKITTTETSTGTSLNKSRPLQNNNVKWPNSALSEERGLRRLIFQNSVSNSFSFAIALTVINKVNDLRVSRDSLVKYKFIFNRHCLRRRRSSFLRWLKTVSSTNISMGHCNYSLSLDATIMVSKHCPIIGEHVVVLFITY